MPIKVVAELIWRKLDGMTQQEVAGELGWSREGVNNYWSLYKICNAAWEIIGTSFSNGALVREDVAVPQNGRGSTRTGCFRLAGDSGHALGRSGTSACSH
jgi:hypothetical protein